MAKLLSNLPIGSLIKFGSHKVGSESSQPIVWMIADKNHTGYPTNSITLITQKIIDLRAYDAVEGNDPESFEYNINYPTSNINQWLNSAASSNWFSKAVDVDHAPDNRYTSANTGYDSRPGFLNNFTEAERSVILPTTLTLRKVSGNYPTTISKVFIPSIREILGTTESDDNTSRLQYFTTGVVTCGLTSQAYSNTTSTSKPSSVNANWNYWTRSGDYNTLYIISDTGSRNTLSPYYGYVGIRPCLNLSANTKISDDIDADGCYKLLPQTAPVLTSNMSGDLGEQTKGFDIAYTVDDADNEPVTVKEYIDNQLIRSYIPTLKSSYTLTVSGTTWTKLANGQHNLRIVATDGFDTVEKQFYFRKNITKLIVTRSAPIPATTRPMGIIVTVAKVIPEGAIFKVEACNDGFDSSPTWEDITSKVTTGQIHNFSNTEVDSGKNWGVNVRVTVDRNGKEGACYITEIGGNFE